MIVIVSNKQKDIIDNANIDAIKDLNGLFNVDDLINKFKNYFFSKMILDATSVVNFASKNVLTTLANEIGPEKLIILLPSSPEPPEQFIKLLIDLKIYNFANNIDDVVKFIDNPNTYENVIKLIDKSSSDSMYVDNSIKEDGTNQEDSNIDSVDNRSSLGDMLNNFSITDSSVNTEENDVSDVDEKSDNLSNVEEVKDITDVDEKNEVEDNKSIMDNFKFDDIVSNDNKISDNKDEDNEDDNSNYNDLYENNTSENENSFLITSGFEDAHYDTLKKEKIVIGVKNVTLHAGSTSLIYMMHKYATINLKKKVLSIEIDKNDFRFFRNKSMISVDSQKVEETIADSSEDIIFVDLNEFDGTKICKDVLYLVEPSTIMLNRLMFENKNTFNELKDKKVVLNKSMLSASDIRTLSSEAGMKFFHNIEALNDRIMNDAIDKLLELLELKN